jgi:peptidoglycan/LPS O-acetylase OafA/YrhL
MTTQAADTTQRNSNIDLLRGIAVLLVVLHHIGLRMPLKQGVLADWIPVRILNAVNFNGYEAVLIFFVISGFLITNISLQRWGSLSHIDIKAFYIRRFARIMPCLLLLIAVLSVLHLGDIKYYTISKPTQSLGGTIFSALTMRLNWYEGKTGWLPGGWDVLWSLSIEEAFYFAFPLLCLLLRSRELLVIGLALLALSLPLSHSAIRNNEIWQEKAYLPGMAAIATGVFTALLAQSATTLQSGTRQRTSQLLFLAGTVGAGSILLFEDMLWHLLKDSTLLILTFASASLILGFHLRKPSEPARGTGWICIMGRQSYEIYLTHMFAVFAVVECAERLNTPKPLALLWYVPVVLLSWLLGAQLERWYSRPCDTYLRGRLLKSQANAS